jgi:heme O synthase-like polyprenyltransferase
MYFWGAFFLGLLFLAASVRMAREKSQASARKLLLTSVIYLPLLMILMMVTKIA